MSDKEHQEMLRSTFVEFAMKRISEVLKEPSLEIIDLIMYFGSAEARQQINEVIMPALVKKMHYIDLIRLEQRLESFQMDYAWSWNTVLQEINLRKKRVEA